MELFNPPAFYNAFNPALIAYSYGRTTALVLDIGSSITACAVYEGSVVRHTVIQSHLSGNDLTELLRQQIVNSQKVTSSATNWNLFS